MMVSTERSLTSMRLPSPTFPRWASAVFYSALTLGLPLHGWGQDAQDLGLEGKGLRSGRITTVTGDLIETDTLLGKVVLVNAWATWCGPCTLEMPVFQRVQDELEHRGFLVLGISADKEETEFVRRFLDDLGIRYPVTVGPQHPLGRLAARVRGLPTSFLLARDGRVVKRIEGILQEETLRKLVLSLLEEDPPTR